MSEKAFQDLATEITIATIQSLELKRLIMTEEALKIIYENVIPETYKAAMKALFENQ